jgi:hypothetical protein
MPDTMPVNHPAGPEKNSILLSEDELVGPVRVLIVDDHESSRRGIRALLSTCPQ